MDFKYLIFIKAVSLRTDWPSG